ncbi:hypothetical protein AAES_95356 [Amazona aestiva]|uniref:Uncharacterized protein n=1 Tax=Amazona aestiva TaxID=12930 RepID=A0A0Q3PHE8_AMAAE|nr:hypothetical protein AAES_95356 [Amazona aestiva]
MVTRLPSKGKEMAINNLSCVFPGPSEIRVDGTTKNTQEYEIVQVVDTGPILRDMAFSVDHEHLYIMSEKQPDASEGPIWVFDMEVWLISAECLALGSLMLGVGGEGASFA